MHWDVNKIIETAKYEVRTGDTLSEIAEDLAREFPSLSSRSEAEEALFQHNRPAFINNGKNLLKAGHILDLKFILQFREKNFRPQFSREYTFTNEDKLAFNLNPNSFWDPFTCSDRDCGEFLKHSFSEMNLSCLPEKIPLNHKIISSFPSHKNLMLKLKNELGSFKKIVNIKEISKLLLKTIGYSSPSNTQINDLSQKLITENNLNTGHDISKTHLPADQIENLSTKCIEEFYAGLTLSSEEIKGLQQGFYIIKEIDELIGLENLKEKILKRMP